MAIKVIKGHVRRNGLRYGMGEIITGLSENEESRIVSEGFAEYIPNVSELEESEAEESKTEGSSDKDSNKEPLSEDNSKNDETVSEDNLDGIEVKFDPGEYVKSARNKTNRE